MLRLPSDGCAGQPAAVQVSRGLAFNNVTVLRQTPQLIALLTTVRDKETRRGDFIFYANRIIRLLVEEGLNLLPVVEHQIETPTGRVYHGLRFEGRICGVSIMRAGESMEAGLRECCREVRIGKILIQRDETTANAVVYYDKLPADISSRWVLLLDPMLATGGSAIKAVQILLGNNVPEERILFLNLISAPEGIQLFAEKFPRLRIVTAFIDTSLDQRKFVIPGIGDFGDRFFGTD